MRFEFMNEPEDVQWLKDTALKGIILPSKYANFKSYVLQGRENAPYAVNMYLSIDPYHSDDYFRICFELEPPIYCQGLEYEGKTDKPYGGFNKLD